RRRRAARSDRARSARPTARPPTRRTPRSRRRGRAQTSEAWRRDGTASRRPPGPSSRPGPAPRWSLPPPASPSARLHLPQRRIPPVNLRPDALLLTRRAVLAHPRERRSGVSLVVHRIRPLLRDREVRALDPLPAPGRQLRHRDHLTPRLAEGALLLIPHEREDLSVLLLVLLAARELQSRPAPVPLGDQQVRHALQDRVQRRTGHRSVTPDLLAGRGHRDDLLRELVMDLLGQRVGHHPVRGLVELRLTGRRQRLVPGHRDRVPVLRRSRLLDDLALRRRRLTLRHFSLRTMPEALLRALRYGSARSHDHLLVANSLPQAAAEEREAAEADQQCEAEQDDPQRPCRRQADEAQRGGSDGDELEGHEHHDPEDPDQRLHGFTSKYSMS